MSEAEGKAPPQLIMDFIGPAAWGMFIMPIIFIILNKMNIDFPPAPTILGGAVYWASPVVEQHYNFMLSHSFAKYANNYLYYNFALICLCSILLCKVSICSWCYKPPINRPTAKEIFVMSIPLLTYAVLDVWGFNEAAEAPPAMLSLRFDNFGLYHFHRLMDAFCVIIGFSYILIIVTAASKKLFRSKIQS